MLTRKDKYGLHLHEPLPFSFGFFSLGKAEAICTANSALQFSSHTWEWNIGK